MVPGGVGPEPTVQAIVCAFTGGPDRACCAACRSRRASDGDCWGCLDCRAGRAEMDESADVDLGARRPRSSRIPERPELDGVDDDPPVETDTARVLRACGSSISRS